MIDLQSVGNKHDSFQANHVAFVLSWFNIANALIKVKKFIFIVHNQNKERLLFSYTINYSD